jgi:SAM-dependent methyltransferase
MEAPQPLPPLAGPSPRPNRCLLCGGAGETVVWREAGYDGRRCACGVVFVDPMPADGGIDFTRDIHPDSFYSLPASDRAAWFAARRTPQGRLLEVGCGEGFSLEQMRARGFEVEGLEPDPARAQRVRDRLGVPVTCEYLESTTLAPHSYDVVYHCDLLSHFPDPIGALRAMARLLKPGGVLFFEAGLHAGFSPLWYHLVGTMGYPMHLWFYDDRAFDRLMERADLRVTARETFSLGPYVLASDAARGVAKALKLGLRGVARALHERPAWAPAERDLDAMRERFDNVMRYDVAAHAPVWGPQTLWIIAEPRRAP